MHNPPNMSLIKRSLAVLALIFAGATLFALPTDPSLYLDPAYGLQPRGAGFSYFPSPEDWRDINMYQIFTDRFADGDPGNNQSTAMGINRAGWYVGNRTDSESRNYHHGGDWKGLKDNLDYLSGMGVRAVWISGVQMNDQGKDTRFTPYHMYHPTDFFNVDPAMGTFQDLKDLVDACHARGIYVIFDVVINHMADKTGLRNGNDDKQYWGGGGSNFGWWNDGRKHAYPFNDLQWFHNNGTINNWDSYPEYIYGQFKGTDDLATEKSHVSYWLAEAFKNLIDATDCDGFRVDAIKHVDYNWVKQWADDIRKHAASKGKNDFILFGEYFSYDNNTLASYCKENGYSFNSALFFPMSQNIKSVFIDGQGSGQLTGQLNNVASYGEGAKRLVAFIDNHDVNRIGLQAGGDVGRIQWVMPPALTFLYTATPVPCLYYGTEHAFQQGGHWNGQNSGTDYDDGDWQRESMFDRGFQPGPAQGNKLAATNAPLYQHIKKLNEARAQYKSLTRGNFTERWNSSGQGPYAYTRVFNDQEALVALNTADGNVSLQPAVSKPNGTQFVNVWNSSDKITVSGGKLTVSLGGRESKIYVAGAEEPVVPADIAVVRDGGNVNFTYKPNDGPLKGASSVTLYVRADGGSFVAHVMTNTGGTFTVTYAIPGGAAGLAYYFQSGQDYDNNGGGNYVMDTSPGFQMDGLFDSQDFLVADSGMRIYAAIRGNKLYTATWSPKGGNNDHAIYITDQFGDPVGVGAASGSDVAANYSSWSGGSNQGTGFGAWTITPAGASSGVFLGNPSAAGISGMDAKSFGLYANGGAGSTVNVYRPISTELAVGDSISFQWSMNWDGNNGDSGKKGFNIWAGSTHLLNVENRGTSDIFVGDQNIGMGYGTQAMTWTITRTASGTLSVSVSGRDGGTYTKDVTVSGSAPDKIEFYAANLAVGDQRQPYFNELKIYRGGAIAKNGRVYGNFSGDTSSKPWIMATPASAKQYGSGALGRNAMGNGGQALESEIDLVQVFGSIPKTLYIAAVAYGGGAGGNVLSQAPASFGNSADDIEITEFQPLNTASIRDENMDGKFDAGAPQMIVSVNGNEADGNYGLRRFYLDEVAGDTAELTVKFKPNVAGAVGNVEVFTNLNRRDHAVLEEDPDTVTAGSDTYYRAYPMSGPDAGGYYAATLPVNLCGAYRLQVRCKVAGVNDGNYIYYTDHAQRRDCAIVVSPKKALTLNMYEVNPLVVEAKDATKDGRSTFLDLVESGGQDGRPDALNQGYYASQGINMLWLQPIHPIGIEGRDTNPETGSAFDPGSPYAVRDYWSVNPVLGRSETPQNALGEFQAFVSQLDQWGVGVMMDGTFNHSSPDVIMGQGAADLGISANTGQEIRAFNPGWFAKEGYPAQPAANAGEIAVAPDRNDFGNWTDVREFYFGDYDALVKEKGAQNPDKSYPDNAYKLAFLLERDEFAGHTPATRQVWNYFAYYPIYWLDKTGNVAGAPKSESYKGIDGLRCDFAQGLPSQFWEYTINKTRSRKWDFIFMAESLDGYREVNGSKRHGVGYRSARHFDVLNENVVFYWRDTFFGYPANGGQGAVRNPVTYDTYKAYDDRRQAFDNVVLLNNLVSHDEVFPHNDVWSIAYAYAQIGSLDGIPMIFYGQEAGAQNSATGYAANTNNFGAIDAANNFGKYEQNFGKNIPNFKAWNHMAAIWNGRTADEWKLQAFYGRVNKARLAAPALQSQNVYFLNKKQGGGGMDDKMFAVGKVKKPGVAISAPGQSVVLAFVNNNYRANSSINATFTLDAAAPGSTSNYFGIERDHRYNVRDLLCDTPGAFVWSTARTGADLIDNGLYVGLPYQPTPASGSYQAHYLQLVDVTSPSITFEPGEFATYQDVVTLVSSNTANAAVTYSLVGGDTGKVTLSGSQLTINSGTGSVTIRATVEEVPGEHDGAVADAVITFRRKDQTISGFTFDINATVSEGTRTLPGTASSGLALTYVSSDPLVASVSGNTLTLHKAGNITLTASQPGDDNYSPVTSAEHPLNVSGASTSFEDEFPGQAVDSDNDHDGIAALAEYGLGGSSSGDDSALLPKATRDGSLLKITAVVRANDPALTVTAESSTDLASAWTTGIEGTRAGDQSGVAAGFERRIYSADIGGNPRGYLRLRFSISTP